MTTAARDHIIQSILAAQELLSRQAQSAFKKFVRYIKSDYEMQWFHALICDKLDDFAAKKIQNMMIFMPPQHGKTELATRLFPPFLFGGCPDLKIAIASYSDSMASGFNRAIQRYIDNEAYAKVFPDTKLNGSQIFKTNYTNYSRTEHLFEIVNKKGSLRTVGRGGSLTGNPVDIGIIDDLYKDRTEARSMSISQFTYDWYVDVFKTRLHNNSQQLIMNTRWDENDLAGRLLKEQPDKWTVICFPAIKTLDINDYDIRQPGEVLWPSRHSLEKILEQKSLSEVSFNSLYQQDPKPDTKLIIYHDWIEVPEWPKDLAVDTYGLDFGKTTGINALVKHAADGYNAAGKPKVYYEELCYESGLSGKAIADILKADGYKGQVVYCDHMPTKIAELRRHGISAFEAVKGAGSIDAGIVMLKGCEVHYTSRSTNLKMEKNNYQWVSYGSVITNIPVDEFNHALDGCRYARYSKYFRQ
jgi:hypothetical protein